MTFETLENMWKISYLNAAFEFLKQVTTTFKHGAQRHALMRYALRWRAALDKVPQFSRRALYTICFFCDTDVRFFRSDTPTNLLGLRQLSFTRPRATLFL